MGLWVAQRDAPVSETNELPRELGCSPQPAPHSLYFWCQASWGRTIFDQAGQDGFTPNRRFPFDNPVRLRRVQFERPDKFPHHHARDSRFGSEVGIRKNSFGRATRLLHEPCESPSADSLTAFVS